MNTIAQRLPYQSTNFFSKLVIDFLAQVPNLKGLMSFTNDIEGIKAAVLQRAQQDKTNRTLLIDVLTRQYKGQFHPAQAKQISALVSEKTFTITTAHQPNLFTGPLYFIYKILHAVQLASVLNKELPDNHFVPVYYIGSEDADLDELNHFTVEGKKYVWQTQQSGAVGRMLIDDKLILLLQELAGQLEVKPFGKEVIEGLRTHYKKGITIGEATHSFVNFLFGAYGLLVINPDDVDLKRAFNAIVKKELREQFSATAVQKQVEVLKADYKVQASGRPLNLFYLIDNRRERIEKNSEGLYTLSETNSVFSEKEISIELDEHPERFSANVILRPVFQETILPNVAFIGGGGEIGYWLELKTVFDAVAVPYPVLILRNSFLLMQEKEWENFLSMGFAPTQIFSKELLLMNEYAEKHASSSLHLDDLKQQLEQLYGTIKSKALAVDKSLERHTAAISHKSLKRLEALEHKMLKAERKKYDTQLAQLERIKSKSFPNNNLQERVESMLDFYARFGPDFIERIAAHSLSVEQQFSILLY